MTLPQLSLVLGGSASGKSAFAEMLVVGTARPKSYLATAQAFDDEMRRKIAAHRDARGPDWHTIEEPLAAADVLRSQPSEGILLLDCVTLWLTNVLLADRNVDAACADLIDGLRDCPCPAVVVSNEVGQGIVPDNALSRQFRAAQGQLNQQLAAKAGLVVMVTAGLPMTLKGQLPR